MTMVSALLPPIQKVAICLILSICTTACYGSNDHSGHRGHSDVLLEILQLKIKINKLQAQYLLNKSSNDESSNMRNQAVALDSATHLLQQYVAIPESRYPNMEMYHQSLISRGALIQEFAALLKVYQEQLTESTIN